MQRLTRPRFSRSSIRSRTEIRFNSEWLDKMRFEESSGSRAIHSGADARAG